MSMSIKRLAIRCEGVAMIEFALILPILVTLFVGGAELTRYIMAHQKVERAAGSLSGFVSQMNNPEEDLNLDQFSATFAQLLAPLDPANGGVIISGVRVDNDGNLFVAWQQNLGAVGSSLVGNAGGGATTELELNEGDEVIVAEMFYRFDPLFSVDELPLERDLYKRMSYIKRGSGKSVEGSSQFTPNLYSCTSLWPGPKTQKTACGTPW